MGQQAIYDWMLRSVPEPWCWRCGRGEEHIPDFWFGPWLIERAHMVNNPRVQDRRVVVLLCSLCHRLQHGHLIDGNYEPELDEPCTLDVMLGLKQLHDPEFYDEDFIAKHHIGNLPPPTSGGAGLMRIYTGRRP